MTTTPNTLQQLVLQETDDGLRPVRFLLEVMDADIEGVKITDRTAAARELLDRCFGRPFTATDRASETYDDYSDASQELAEKIRQAMDDMSDEAGVSNEVSAGVSDDGDEVSND